MHPTRVKPSASNREDNFYEHPLVLPQLMQR
jgi:hypothetical protein